MRLLKKRRNLPKQLAEGEDGTTAVEYAVMLAVIIASIIAVLGLSRGPLERFWQRASEMFPSSSSSSPD